MKRFFKIFFILTLFILSERVSWAKENIVTASAQLSVHNNKPAYDSRISTLKKFFLTYNSPLAKYSEDFIYWADYYGLDYRLVPAITGVESTFGKRIPKGSYNAYGWNSGNYSFKSWPDSIEHVSKTLKVKYYDKGANTIDKIAKRYAPPSRTWAYNVRFFMERIEGTPVRYEL